ncbi:hypothetical protein MHBO_003539 [Bonamia ostreae]|uniref:RRM domain-containing protein n=1 Tax=Bonamia ostreae TaxID=126728 RepID=A0ABV2AQS1_9EUKA
MVDVSNSNSDNKKTPDSDSSINSEAQFKELTATAKDWDYDFFDKETRIEKEPDITSTLLITGLPKIPDEKTAKLKNVIKKKFKSFGKISTEDITIFREENTDLSTGSCIIKFRSSGDAHAALALKKFDKNHSLQSVCVQDCLDTDTRLQKMTKTLSVLKESDALFSHNNDIRQRCQFLVRCGAKTTVCWHDPLRLSLEGRDPFVDYDENKGEAATELILPTEEITITAVRWSKTGKFLGAIGSKGQIVVYGGSPLKKLCEFGQKFCDFEFSPMDNFVVAIKTEDPQARSRQSRAIVVTRVAEVWDFLLVKLTVVVSLKTGLRLKWSFDEKYFAFMTNSGISFLVSQLFV